MPTSTTHESPAIPKAASLLTDHIGQASLITLFATCEVEYEGRNGAASYLDVGDRHIIAKQDGSLKVDRDNGVDPVNWQRSGATYHVSHDETEVTLKARHPSPVELVTIHLTEIHRLSIDTGVQDSAALELNGTEEDIHEYIHDHPNELEEGLRILEHERQTPDGYIDFWARDTDGQLVIIEVKRRSGKHEHVNQLHRYVTRFRDDNPDVRGVLVAPSISDDAERVLNEKGLEFKEMLPEFTDPADPDNKQLDDFF